MKFLVPNYSCLQNPWLGGTAHRSLFSLSSTEFVEPPPPNKIPGYATGPGVSVPLYSLRRCVVMRSPGPWWRGKILPTRQACLQSLHWLSYTGSFDTNRNEINLEAWLGLVCIPRYELRRNPFHGRRIVRRVGPSLLQQHCAQAQ